VDEHANVFLMGCTRTPDLRNSYFLAQEVFDDKFLMFDSEHYGQIITGQLNEWQGWNKICNFWYNYKDKQLEERG